MNAIFQNELKHRTSALSAHPAYSIRRFTTVVCFLTALMVIMNLAACGGGGSTAQNQLPPNATFATRFDSMWQTFDQKYVYFDYKNIDWPGLRDTYRPMAIQATNDQQFAQTIVTMLSNLHDLHVKLIDPSGNQIQTATETHFINFDQNVWQQYLNNRGTSVQQGNNFVTATLGGVAYIAIQSWQPATSTQAANLDTALEQFRNASGIIIDVRMNGGGDASTAYTFAGRFADQTHTGDLVKFRNGPLHSDFGPLQANQFGPRGHWQFTAPVLLLIGRESTSSTEEFISAMRELPNVTVVGDTSGGHSGFPSAFDLGNGWQYTVSEGFNYTAEQQIIEDNGIAPATAIPVAATDFQAGQDPVLNYAIIHLGGH